MNDKNKMVHFTGGFTISNFWKTIKTTMNNARFHHRILEIFKIVVQCHSAFVILVFLPKQNALP